MMRKLAHFFSLQKKSWRAEVREENCGISFFLSFFVVSCLCGLTNGQKKRSIEEVTVQLGGMIAQSFFIQNHFYLSRLS